MPENSFSLLIFLDIVKTVTQTAYRTIPIIFFILFLHTGLYLCHGAPLCHDIYLIGHAAIVTGAYFIILRQRGDIYFLQVRILSSEGDIFLIHILHSACVMLISCITVTVNPHAYTAMYVCEFYEIENFMKYYKYKLSF